MTRNQIIMEELQQQAQTIFWQYSAQAEMLATPITIAAYRSNFHEFLKFLAYQINLKKVDSVKKKHIEAYISCLKSKNCNDYFISKQVQAICFWLELNAEKGQHIPKFEDFNLEHPINIKAKTENQEDTVYSCN